MGRDDDQVLIGESGRQFLEGFYHPDPHIGPAFPIGTGHVFAFMVPPPGVGPADGDLVGHQPAPLPIGDLPPARVGLDPEPEVPGYTFDRVQAAPQVAGDDAGDRHPSQAAGERFGLLPPERRKGDVVLAYEATLGVAFGLCMTED